MIAHTYLYPLLHVQLSMVDNNKGHDYDPSLQMLTAVVDGEWAQVDELFLFFLNLGDGHDCKTLRDTVALPSARDKKYSAKTLPSVTLGIENTTSTVSANSYLPSVFYRALGKNKLSAKKS